MLTLCYKCTEVMANAMYSLSPHPMFNQESARYARVFPLVCAQAKDGAVTGTLPGHVHVLTTN